MNFLRVLEPWNIADMDPGIPGPWWNLQMCEVQHQPQLLFPPLPANPKSEEDVKVFGGEWRATEIRDRGTNIICIICIYIYIYIFPPYPNTRVNICSASEFWMIFGVGFFYFEKMTFLEIVDMHWMIFDINSKYLVNIWSKFININQI